MASTPTSSTTRSATLSDPAYQAFLLLRMVFSVAPILFGLDKFANFLVPWPSYLAPWIDDIVPGTAAGDVRRRCDRDSELRRATVWVDTRADISRRGCP